MILDKDKNIEKNNEPISVAVSDNGFYQGVKDSWLVQDIKNMLVDPQYAKIDKMNFLFHWSTVSVDWSNTFMNVGANKIKYWRRKIAAFPLIGAKFLNY